MPIGMCAMPRCPHPAQQHGYCRTHYTPRRGSSARGYTYEWQRFRLDYLARYPLCVACLARDQVTSATDVDHIIRHRGQDDPRFWDEANLQPLCHACHARKTAVEGRGHAIPAQ